MTDAISLLMFAVPLGIALIFTIIAIIPKGEDRPSNIFSGSVVTFLSCLLASIGWFIFGLTWPVLAATEMFTSVAYLWYALGVIFAILTVYVGMRMLGTIFETEQPRLVLKYDDD